MNGLIKEVSQYIKGNFLTSLTDYIIYVYTLYKIVHIFWLLRSLESGDRSQAQENPLHSHPDRPAQQTIAFRRIHKT